MIMNIISGSACKAAQASSLVVNFERGLNMDPFFHHHHHHHRKDKVVIILGATGSGKSKLAIDLATHFTPAEVINSDKIQLYKGLDIATNKVTQDECQGVPHHLLGIVDPNHDFTADDFILHASSAMDSIIHRHSLPIIAGGSNSYIEALVNHHHQTGRPTEFCFLWVDVSLPVLHAFLTDRVDRMVEAGLVEEVRKMFNPKADYTKGIRKAIGVPELDEFLEAEMSPKVDEKTKKKLLEVAINKMKVNNCRLASRQLHKIHRLQGLWNVHRLDATEAIMLKNNNNNNNNSNNNNNNNVELLSWKEAWENQVMKKSKRIVHKFLYEEESHSHVIPVMSRSTPSCCSMVATVAATY